MSKLPKVKWLSDKETEKLAGYRRRYENSWIKGICDKEKNVIYLNTSITKLNHPIFYETECLVHEFFHFIFRHPKIDNMFDTIGLIIDTHLYNRTYWQNHRRKRNANNT